MKILFISALFPHPQGISGSSIVYNRMRLLAEQGHQIGLLSFARDDDERCASALKPLVSEMELFPDPRSAPSFRRVARSIFSGLPFPFAEARVPAMLRKTGEMVERARYHVAIAEFSVMGQYLYRNPWLPAVRKIVSCHECLSSEYLNAVPFQGWSRKVMMKRAVADYIGRYELDMYHDMDHVIVLTSEERHRLLKRAPGLRISVVPHGVDTAFFAPPEHEQRGENIVFVGYYPNESNRDAVLWFVRAVWPRLKKKHPHLKFYVVGRNPTPAIRELGRRDERIIVTGAVDDIRPYLNISRVFICPIRMGSGFRAKLLEAMAAGVPVVSTSLGAEGICSWSGDAMFLADTPSQMLRNISLLLEDEELRRSMAASARELVTSRFSKEYGVSVLNNLVRDVMLRD